MAQPGELRVVLAVALAAFLVPPVGSDADLADLVHPVGPDLDLERLSVECDHGGVERLVEVVLRVRDVVVELAGDRSPEGMDDAERRVAVADVVDEDPDRVDVVDLGELGALALHLLVDAVDVLGAALQIGIDAGVLEPRLELADRPRDVVLATLAPRVEQPGELPEPLRLEDLHAADHSVWAGWPLRERGVDLLGLAGDPDLLLRGQPVEGPHVVEPIGQLDEDDPDVLGHREEHLPDVLGLLLLVAVGAELRELRDAVDEPGDLGPEPLLDVLEPELRVLGHVVQKRRGDRDRVDPELGDDLGGRDRVRHVRLAGRPSLCRMGLDGKGEGALDRIELRLRVVGPDGLEELLPERRDVGTDRRRHPLVRAGRRGSAGPDRLPAAG